MIPPSPFPTDPLRISFTVPTPAGPLPRFVYTYLIVASETITLIDTGVAGSEQLIFNRIRQIGRRPEEISTVILTHAHPDHIGAAKAIREATGCTIAAHRRDQAWIEDPGRQATERPTASSSRDRPSAAPRPRRSCPARRRHDRRRFAPIAPRGGIPRVVPCPARRSWGMLDPPRRSRDLWILPEAWKTPATLTEGPRPREAFPTPPWTALRAAHRLHRPSQRSLPIGKRRIIPANNVAKEVPT